MTPFRPSKTYNLDAIKQHIGTNNTSDTDGKVSKPSLVLEDFLLKGHTLYKKFRTKNDEVQERKVGEVVLVDEVIKNLDQREVQLKLRFRFFNDWKTEIIPRGKLIKTELGKLMSLGLDVGGGKIDDMLAFIDVHEKIATVSYNHHKLGWYKHGEHLLFRLQEVLSTHSKLESVYKGNLAMTPKGSLDAWQSIVQEHVIGHAGLELMIAASLAAPIVGLMNITELAEVDSLLINMVGNSTTGKTTAAMVAASVFGSPSLSNNGLIQSFNGTANALQSIISGNQGVTLIFDETSMNRMNKSDFSALIYKLAQNKEKARLNKEAELKETERWATVLLFTGESSILGHANANEGLYVRLFEFQNVQWTGSAEHADALKDQLLGNYGHAGFTYIENLIKIPPEEIKATWEKYSRDLQDVLPHTRFVNRISQKFALILTGAHYGNEYLGLGLSIPNITNLLIEQEEASMDERELAPKFHSLLREYIIMNRRNFKYNDEHVSSSQLIFGKIEVKNSESYCYILRQHLNNISKELGFTDVGVLVSELNKKGYMKSEKDRIQIKKQVFKKDEVDARSIALPEKSYSAKGDLTYCFIFEGDIIDEFNESVDEKEQRLSTFDPNRSKRKTIPKADRLFDED